MEIGEEEDDHQSEDEGVVEGVDEDEQLIRDSSAASIGS